MKSFFLTLIYLGSLFALPAIQAADDPSSPSATNSHWDWKVDENKALELHGKNGLIWRLNFVKDLDKFYFHPLRTIDGKDLTWTSPPDHIWHYGLWFSWKTINGVNYWEIPQGRKYPVGRTMITKTEVIDHNQESANVRIHLKYRPSESAEDVATAVVDLLIETPRKNGSYAIDWSITTKALKDLNFGRTSGYGGLSHRAAESLTSPVFLSARGPETSNKPWFIAEPSPWVDFSALSDNKPVGVTMFDHPSNPRSPSRWFMVNRMIKSKDKSWPFYYNNAAIVAKKPLLLAKGETLQLRYRTLIHSGRGDAKAIQAEAARFATKE